LERARRTGYDQSYIRGFLWADCSGYGKMKNASKEKRSELDAYFKKNPLQGHDLPILKHLHMVTDVFIQVQQRREEADYDIGKVWNQTDVLTQIAAVRTAFESWKEIRDEPVAQAYLVSLLGMRPRSE
jgi:hypothetical protein